MGEDSILRDFIGGVVEETVKTTLAAELPKYLKKPTKRYYTIGQVCELMNIKRSTYFTRAQRGDFIIKKEGRITLIDAEDLDEKMDTKVLCKHARTRRRG